MPSFISPFILSPLLSFLLFCVLLYISFYPMLLFYHSCPCVCRLFFCSLSFLSCSFGAALGESMRSKLLMKGVERESGSRLVSLFSFLFVLFRVVLVYRFWCRHCFCCYWCLFIFIFIYVSFFFLFRQFQFGQHLHFLFLNSYMDLYTYIHCYFIYYSLFIVFSFVCLFFIIYYYFLSSVYYSLFIIIFLSSVIFFLVVVPFASVVQRTSVNERANEGA